MAASTPILTSWRALPAEIRFMIYRQTWRSRRIFILERGTVAYCEQSPPATLLLNAEAREKTLRHYRPLLVGPDGKVIYFNPDIDVLWLDSRACEYRRHGWSRPDDIPRTLLDLISQARHVILQGSWKTRVQLCQTIISDPERFRNVVTIDILVMLAASRRAGRGNNVPFSTWVLTRVCRAPGCTAPDISSPSCASMSPYLVLLTDADVEDGRIRDWRTRNWRTHVLRALTTDYFRPEGEPVRTCDQTAQGQHPCDILDQARARVFEPPCSDPDCSFHAEKRPR